MLSLYRFSAYNSQTEYGWGTEEEAGKYCDYLNRSREINVYGYREITDVDEIMKRDEDGEVINLADALNEIADEEQTWR